DSLLFAILMNAIKMLSYSFYEGRGIEKCQVSNCNLSHYIKYIRLNRFKYDV
ncbi:hypothetical protein QBC46DRAFT_234064, partial [Diplogelasinospora grovesii]